MSEVKSKQTLNNLLHTILGSNDLVERWWHSPNQAFDNRMPKDVYYQDPQGRQEISDYITTYSNGEYK